MDARTSLPTHTPNDGSNSDARAMRSHTTLLSTNQLVMSENVHLELVMTTSLGTSIYQALVGKKVDLRLAHESVLCDA